MCVWFSLLVFSSRLSLSSSLHSLLSSLLEHAKKNGKSSHSRSNLTDEISLVS